MEELKTQWHPAFCSAMELVLEEDREYLEFIREYNLNTKPLEVDLLIIKKPQDHQVKDKIGRIFKLREGVSGTNARSRQKASLLTGIRTSASIRLLTLFQLLQRLGQLVRTGSFAGSAEGSLELPNDVVYLHPRYKFCDSGGIAGAASDKFHICNDSVLRFHVDRLGAGSFCLIYHACLSFLVLMANSISESFPIIQINKIFLRAVFAVCQNPSTIYPTLFFIICYTEKH